MRIISIGLFSILLSSSSLLGIETDFDSEFCFSRKIRKLNLSISIILFDERVDFENLICVYGDKEKLKINLIEYIL
jgi:hypothetical protein